MSVQIIPDKIRLNSIKVLSGSIDCPQELAMRNPVFSHLTSNFEADFRVNTDNTVPYFLKVKLQGLDANFKEIQLKAEYSIAFTFLVENLNDYIIEKTQSGTVVENMLASTLMGIAYSTARGIILCRTEGTILGGVILPVIDPKNLIAHKERKSSIMRDNIR